MALTNPHHFETDMIKEFKIGFKQHLLYGGCNFNHKVIKQYMILFDKVITKNFLKEYRNPSYPAMKVMIDRYAKEKNIKLKEL